MNHLAPTLTMYARRLSLVLSAVCTTTGSANASMTMIPATTTASTASIASTVIDSGAPPAAIRGIPNQPDVVTVVPFYWKPNETAQEQTKVVIPAEVDGAHGIFILDLGSPILCLNRTFSQPNATGGIDSVTDANRAPESGNWDKVHVTMRIGTLLD